MVREPGSQAVEVPWCDTCSKYWAPNAMKPDGGCPTCGVVLATKGSLQMEARTLGLPGPGQEEGEVPKPPWHFKVLLGALVVYLGWRGVQGVEWLLRT